MLPLPSLPLDLLLKGKALQVSRTVTYRLWRVVFSTEGESITDRRTCAVSVIQLNDQITVDEVCDHSISAFVLSSFVGRVK